MPTAFDVSALDVEGQPAPALLKMVHNIWGDKLLFACGFTPEDVVLLHMAQKLGLGPRAFFIDTGRHFEATYAYAAKVRASLGLTCEWVFPEPSQLTGLMASDGPFRMARDVQARRRCCDVRRLQPLREVLEQGEAYVVGARREQTPKRSQLKKMDVDDQYDWIPRVAPLADWTLDSVLEYLRDNGLPLHPLFDKGYRSIGCAACTRPVEAGQPERAGRWPFEESGVAESGSHISGNW